MVTLERNLVEKLAKTNLSEDSSTKETLNNIILKSFYNSSTDAEEVMILAVAKKYELECYEQLISIIEEEGFKLPF